MAQDSIQWERIELTAISKTTYQAVFVNGEDRGEAELEIDDPEAHWSEVAKHLRDEYRCPVVVNMPPGSDPERICFDFGNAYKHQLKERGQP